MEGIYYQKSDGDNELLRKLRKRVKARIASLHDNRSFALRAKVIILALLYFGSFGLAMLFAENPFLYLGLFSFMGVILVLMYLNIFHEAAHDNIYKNKKHNQWALGLFDLVGASSYIWKKRHIMSHHNFANVDGWDTDVEQSGPIKIFPHVPARGIQKYQHLYIFLAYPFYLFNWMLLRDFRDFFSKRRIIYKIHGRFPLGAKIRFILLKLFYFFYQIVLPIWLFKVSFQLAITAWIIQIFVASIFALFVLLPLHAVPENAFPLPDGDNRLPYGWLRHQLAVTNDLTHNNWFVRHVLGSFNYHVAHHIFPTYHYAYYPEISDELQKFAKEHGLNYKQFSLGSALKKHHQLLKMNAHNIKPFSQLFEELDS